MNNNIIMGYNTEDVNEALTNGAGYIDGVISLQLGEALKSRDISIYDVFTKWLKTKRSIVDFSDWLRDVTPNCLDTDREEFLHFVVVKTQVI
jgi:hypothetical protein